MHADTLRVPCVRFGLWTCTQTLCSLLSKASNVAALYGIEGGVMHPNTMWLPSLLCPNLLLMKKKKKKIEPGLHGTAGAWWCWHSPSVWPLAKALPPTACTAGLRLNQVLKDDAVHGTVIGCVSALHNCCSQLCSELLCLIPKASRCEQAGGSYGQMKPTVASCGIFCHTAGGLSKG